MPRSNRVTPLGELISVPERGLVYGNRGCLHDGRGAIRRRWAVRRWIACRLQFRGRRRRPLMMPGRYTELFLLDEVTALAAGHRPCAECRREDYRALQHIWATEYGLGEARLRADAIDERLHAERLTSDGARRLHDLTFGVLPDGAFVLLGEDGPDGGEPWLVYGEELLRWTPAGYTGRVPRPGAHTRARVLTPPSLLALLSAGWDPVVPLVHPSASRGLGTEDLVDQA